MNWVSAIFANVLYFSSGEYNNTDIVIRPVSQTARGAIGAGRNLSKIPST